MINQIQNQHPNQNTNLYRGFSNNFNDYTYEKDLGKGSFGLVQQFTYNGESYAIKTLDKQRLSLKKGALERINQEVKIHKICRHKNIIALKHVIDTHLNIYLIMEKAEKSLAEYISCQPSKRCTEYRARIWTEEILDALLFMAKKKIIHRDLSTSNILIDKHDTIKICDFGLATIRRDGPNGQTSNNHTMCGTPNFLAPEVANNTGHGAKTDVFSLGCVFYTMLIGEPPFNTTSTRETLERVKKQDYHIPNNIGLSIDAKHLIERLLQTEDKRPSLISVKSDKFFGNDTNSYDLRASGEYEPMVTKDSAYLSGQSNVRSSLSSTGGLAYSGHYSHSRQTGSAALHNIVEENTSQNQNQNQNHQNFHTNSNHQNLYMNRQHLQTLDDSVLNTSNNNEYQNLKLPYTSATPDRPKMKKAISSTNLGRNYRGLSVDNSPIMQQNNINNNLNSQNLSTPVMKQRIFKQMPNSGTTSKAYVPKHASGLPSFSNTNHKKFQMQGLSRSHSAHPSTTPIPGGRTDGTTSANDRPISQLSNIGGPLAAAQQGVSSSFHKEPSDELTRPLSCKRLSHQQSKGSASRSTIKNNNEGCVLEVMNKSNLVHQVMHVSSDGMNITIGVVRKKAPLSSNGDTVTLDLLKNIEKYSFDNLPQKYYKKYKHLRTLCDLSRSQTAKITIYTQQAKNVLLEYSHRTNGATSGDFEATFYKPKSSVKLIFESKTSTKLIFRRTGQPGLKFEKSAIKNLGQDLKEDWVRGKILEELGTENFQNQPNNIAQQLQENEMVIICLRQIEHAWNTRNMLIKMEQSLSEFEALNGNIEQNLGNNKNNPLAGSLLSTRSDYENKYSFFPAIFSMRPASSTGGSNTTNTTPLSTAPNSARDRDNNNNNNNKLAQKKVQGIMNTPPAGSQGRRPSGHNTNNNLMSLNTNLQSLGSLHTSDLNLHEVSPVMKGNNLSLAHTQTIPGQNNQRISQNHNQNNIYHSRTASLPRTNSSASNVMRTECVPGKGFIEKIQGGYEARFFDGQKMTARNGDYYYGFGRLRFPNSVIKSFFLAYAHAHKELIKKICIIN